MNKLNIYLKNLDYNLKVIRNQLRSNTMIFAVVKAWAYGSDMIRIGKHLEKLDVDYLAVAYAEEGRILRQEGINLPILVFYPQLDGLKTIIDSNLEPSLYSASLLRKFHQLLKPVSYTHLTLPTKA